MASVHGRSSSDSTRPIGGRMPLRSTRADQSQPLGADLLHQPADKLVAHRRLRRRLTLTPSGSTTAFTAAITESVRACPFRPDPARGQPVRPSQIEHTRGSGAGVTPRRSRRNRRALTRRNRPAPHQPVVDLIGSATRSGRVPGGGYVSRRGRAAHALAGPELVDSGCDDVPESTVCPRCWWSWRPSGMCLDHPLFDRLMPSGATRPSASR
jgi:hypothetical protein